MITAAGAVAAFLGRPLAGWAGVFLAAVVVAGAAAGRLAIGCELLSWCEGQRITLEAGRKGFRGLA